MNIHDLNRELEIEQKILERLKKHFKNLLKGNGPSGYPSGASYIDANNIHGQVKRGFTDTLYSLGEIEIAIEEQEKKVLELENYIKEIKGLIDGLKGLPQKVKYMQLVEGKSLKEIAEALGYNYGYVRNIVSKK